MIYLDNIDHGQAIGDRCGTSFVSRLHRAVSITSGGNLLGGVIYTDFTGRAISMHAAGWSPRWLTRDMLWTIFTYPFDMLQVEQCIAPVASTNTRSMKLCLGLGFRQVTFIPDVVPAGHLMILSMRRETCRWLQWQPRYLNTGEGSHNGQEQQRTSGA